MKSIYKLMMFGLVLLFLPNCGNNNNSSQQTGATVMSANCYYSPQATMGVAGQPCSFNYAQVSGFGNYGKPASIYGQTSLGLGGTSGCGASQMTGAQMYPVYSPSLGLGCVDPSYFGNVGTPVQYTLQGMNFVPVGGASPYGGYTSAMTSSGTVLRECDSGNPCASPNRCLPPYPSYAGSGYAAPGGYGVCFY